MVTEQNSDSGSNPRREHVGDSDWEQLPVNALVVEERLHGPRGLVVDPQTRRVHMQDREVHLTQQSFDLLAYLLHERGRVVSNDELIRAVWGHTVIVGRHFVQTAVYRLREALRTAGVAGVDDLIEAVRGVGYRIDSCEDDRDSIRAMLGGRTGMAAALRVSALPSMLIDGRQRILFANQALARLTGYSVDELEALPSAEVLTPPAVRKQRHADLQALLAGAHEERWSEPVLRRDGSVLHLELFAESIELDGGIVVALVQVWLKRGEPSAIEPLWRPESQIGSGRDWRDHGRPSQN